MPAFDNRQLAIGNQLPTSRVNKWRKRTFKSNVLRGHLTKHSVCMSSFGSRLCNAIRLRTKRAKIPALLVLHCGRPVGIKDVSLVKHCVSNLFHQTEIHTTYEL